VKQIEGTEMAKAKKRKQQQSCKIIRTIDMIQEAAGTAMKIYRAVEPIAKAILTNGRRTK
jgi:flagellar biosynthesis regulator FlaF